MIGQLAAIYPDSWGLIPKGMFLFGSGGVAGVGSICGGAMGGIAVMTQMGAPASFKNEYLAWYEKTLIPSNAAYLDYRSGTWVPGGTTGGVWGGAGLPIPLNNAPKARPNSNLCHASHTNWRSVSATWLAVNGSGANQDRCSKLVYDCVFKLATLINTWKAGGTVSGAFDPVVAACKASNCHGATNGHPEASGSMKCTPCHTQRIGDNHNL